MKDGENWQYVFLGIYLGRNVTAESPFIKEKSKSHNLFLAIFLKFTGLKIS